MKKIDPRLYVGFDLGGFENELDDPCFVSVLRCYDFNVQMAKDQGKEISADVYVLNGLRHIDGPPPTENSGCMPITGIRQNIGNVDALPVEIGTSKFNYVQLLAMLLSKLKRAADLVENRDVNQCCIAIPSFFTDIQRRAVYQAAKVAGLTPLRLLHECTAVALSYGMEESKNLNNLKDKHVLVLNVDKNTMQACVAKFIASKIEIIGKRDIEMEILAHAYNKEFGEKTFEDVIYKHWNDSTTFAKWKNKFLTEKKKQLEETELINQLENISAPLRGLIREVLHEAHLKPNEIGSIVLAGSGTQYPQIPNIIKDVLGRKPERWTYASAIESVAKGCAMHCLSLGMFKKITENTSERERRLMKFNITEKFISPIRMQIKNSNDEAAAISIPKGLPSSSEVVTFHTTLPCTVDLLLGTTLSSSHQIGFVQASQVLDAIVELRLRIHVDISGIDSVSAKVLYKDEEIATKAFEYVAEKNETSSQEPRVPSLYVTKLLYNALADDLLSKSTQDEAVMFFRGQFQQVFHRKEFVEEDKILMVTLQPLLDTLAVSLPLRLMVRKCERRFKEIGARKNAIVDFNTVTDKDTYSERMPKICADAKAWLEENPHVDSFAIRIKIQSIHDAYLELNKKQQAKQQGEQAILYGMQRLELFQKNRFVGHFEDKFHGIRITFNLERDDLATIIDYLRMRLADNNEADKIMGCRMLSFQLNIFGTENLTRFEIVGKGGQRPAIYFRNDNLYIVAFENGEAQIYELAPSEMETKPTGTAGNEAEDSCSQTKPTDHTDSLGGPGTPLFPNSIILKCQCDYRSLVDYNPENPTERDDKNKKLSTDLYIKRFIEVLDKLKLTEECIDVLWKYKGDPAQYKELIQTLMTCAIMICETARFRIVYEAVFKGFKHESKLLMYVIWNWGTMSVAIRNSKTSEEISDHLVRELTKCGVKVDMQTIANMLYLVLNRFLPILYASPKDARP